MKNITVIYKKGDATNIKENEILVHISNNIGKWGAGFVLAISKKYKQPERTFKRNYKDKFDSRLGDNQLIVISNKDNKFVMNMIAQQGIRRRPDGSPPIDYPALKNCLEDVQVFCKLNKVNVIMPRIGCGLGGGKWEKIEEIINKTLIDKGINVTVYDI